MPVQVLWRSCFVFFVFFDACAGFVKIMLSFVCFSQCLRMFCQSLPRWKNEKTCVSPAFQTLQVHKTLYITMFCAYFLSKTTPPWWPALLKNGKAESCKNICLTMRTLGCNMQFRMQVVTRPSRWLYGIPELWLHMGGSTMNIHEQPQLPSYPS